MNYRFIALILFAVTAHADVYKWTDASGRTHYESSPGAGKSESLHLQGSTGQAANSLPKVVMYATSWCPYCAKARAYFTSKHISFNEQDIENSSSAKRAYDKLGGNGVPLILVDNERMQGFNAEQFDALYQQQLRANGR